MSATDDEAQNLRRLFESGDGIRQADFARKHGIPGGASMLNQHLAGRRPISLQAAVAYARGFGVPLRAISPRLAQQVQEAIAQLGADAAAAPAPAPRQPPIDLRAALIRIGELFDASDPHTRAAVAPLLAHYVQAPPEQRARVARAIEILLTGGPPPSAAPLPAGGQRQQAGAESFAPPPRAANECAYDGPERRHTACVLPIGFADRRRRS